MDSSKEISSTEITVRVAHDLQRQILEITSLLRVINNYYKKKKNLQIQLKTLILEKIEDELKLLNNKDHLKTLPTILNTLDNKNVKEDNLVKFPGSVLLFEAWMHLGTHALYPRIALHLQFPGFVKGEKIRNIFQFIFSTSRGFGFPINFGPEFYHYRFKLAKYFDPLLKWAYTVSHRANQAIVLGNKSLKSNRHHPGEFESVIISEHKNNLYKGIDTILHGYFKSEANSLGNFYTLDEVLQNSTFYYSIGDHAMRIENKSETMILNLPLITNQCIINNYYVDFYSYVKELLNVNDLIIQKINYYKNKRNELISNLNKKNKLKFRYERSKHSAKKLARMSQKLSKKYPIIDKYDHYKTLLAKIRDLLFTTPIYMHSFISSKESKKSLQLLNIDLKIFNQNSQKLVSSVLLSFINYYEKKHEFNFDEQEILYKLKELQDKMTKMWSLFKERHYKFALERIKELAFLSIDETHFRTKINVLLDTLLPIIAIYEFFNKPLFESVYPESVPQTKRPWAYLASFLASKYNPLGTKLMKLFNRLAFQNWSYLILKKGLNRKELFNYLLRLPIWKHIPRNVKQKIIINNSK